MKKEDCYLLGGIIKTHGLKGEVQVFLDVDEPDLYEDLESVFVEIKQKLVPFFIQSIQIQGSKAIVKFEDMQTIEAAQAIVNCDLYLPLEALPPLEEDDFYLHQIIGYTVKDEVLGVLGKVGNIYEGTQDLIGMNYQDKEILIPIVEEIVLRSNHATQELFVKLPEGLLELYLNEDKSLQKDDEDEEE